MRTLGPWKRVWRSMASVALLVTNVGLVQLAGVQPAHAVNVLILSQGFDGVTPPALPAGWTATRADGRNSDQTWQTSTPGFTTDPNAVSVGAHGHVTDMILESPAFVAGPAATVRFYKQAILQATTGQFSGDNLDGAVLEIKIGTASYVDFVAAGGSFTAGEGYNRKIASNQDNPLAGRMAWSGHQLGSSLTSGTLPGSASGQTVRLRWRLGTSKHTANQAGQNWFLAKAFTIDSVEIYSDKAGQTISFTTTAPSNPPVGGTYTPTATATSGLPVAFSIASGSSSVCSIGAADLVTFNAIGSCTIQATQGGNYAFTPAGGVNQFVDVVAAQADVTPPTCSYTIVAGPPKHIDFTVQDPGGLASIQVITAVNIVSPIPIPAFTAGTTALVTFPAEKDNQSMGSQIAIVLQDVAGNQSSCS